MSPLASENPPKAYSRDLTIMIDQTESLIRPTREDEPTGESSSDSDSGSDEDNVPQVNEVNEGEDLVRIIQIQTSHLIRVGPTIQKVLACAEKTESQYFFPPVAPFRISGPAHYYVSLIQERFPQAQDSLVARLGEANWQRHNHVRQGLLHKQVDYVENATSVFRPYSTFHDSGLGTSKPEQSEDAASHTSFLSSNSEAKRGVLRVPQAPEQVTKGESFPCPICGQTQRKIRNRLDWKSVCPAVSRLTFCLLIKPRMHVFADIKPYICTFSPCKIELAQFSNRAAWAEHEFSEHRNTCCWRCTECLEEFRTASLYLDHLLQVHQRAFSDIGRQIATDTALEKRENGTEGETCPVCLTVPGKSKRLFIKHVCHHMEQIALMALPIDGDESEGDESNMTESIGTSEIFT